jgi:hypothetical protein
MVSPMRNLSDPLDPHTDHLQPLRGSDRKPRRVAPRSRSDEAPGDDDFQRLEASIEWLKREGMTARLETEHCAREENRRLPRAALLPPVARLPSVDGEGSARQRDMSTFRLAPPLPCDRLQLKLPSRRHYPILRGAVCLLIASVIAGSIAYNISAEGMFSAWQPAQAAALQGR